MVSILPRLLSFIVAAGVVAAGAARAGPPLLSDDPHTIGPGNVEAILSASGVGTGDSGDVSAPAADLTLGLFDGIDLTIVGAPVFTLSRHESTYTTGTLEVGVKWQPVRGEHWNAAFTPTAAIDAVLFGESNVILPVQVEYAWSESWLGLDAGYVIDLDDSDVWFAAVQGGLAVTRSVDLVGEVWTGQATADDPNAAGFSLGLDWVIPGGPHLLAAGGPGFAFSGNDRARWYAYFGLQWDFALWSRHYLRIQSTQPRSASACRAALALPLGLPRTPLRDGHRQGGGGRDSS